MKSFPMSLLGAILFAVLTTITRISQTSTLTDGCTAGQLLNSTSAAGISFNTVFFLLSLLLFYLYIAQCFLNVSLQAFKQDKTKSTDDTFISIVILTIATIFWPIIMPISYLELVKREVSRVEPEKFI